MLVAGELIAAGAPAPAPVHDIYSGLMTPDGRTSCCSSQDCREVPWRQVGGRIEWLVDGRWVRANSETLVGPIDGQAHACWPRGSTPPEPRCLVPPGMGA